MPRTLNLVILHNTNREAFEEAFKEFGIQGPLRIVRYTGGVVPEPPPAGELWIMRRIKSASDAISESEARELLHWVERGADEGDLPPLLQRKPALLLLPALAILCQGVLARQFILTGAEPGPGVAKGMWLDVLREAGFIRDDDPDGEVLRERIRAKVGSQARSLEVRDWRTVLGEMKPESEAFTKETQGLPAQSVVALLQKVHRCEELILSEVANAYLELAKLLRGGGLR